MEKIQYRTLTERGEIIQEKKGNVLLEEWNHFDGNFLIFGDKYPVEEKQETMEELVERKIKELVDGSALKTKP